VTVSFKIIGEFKVTFHGNPIMCKNLHSSSPSVSLERVHDFKHTLYNCVTTVYCHIGQNKSLKSSTLIYDTTFDDLLNALKLLVMNFACKFCPIDWWRDISWPSWNWLCVTDV